MVCHKLAIELMAHLVGRQDLLEKRIYFQQGILKKNPNPRTNGKPPQTQHILLRFSHNLSKQTNKTLN